MFTAWFGHGSVPAPCTCSIAPCGRPIFCIIAYFLSAGNATMGGTRPSTGPRACSAASSPTRCGNSSATSTRMASLRRATGPSSKSDARRRRRPLLAHRPPRSARTRSRAHHRVLLVGRRQWLTSLDKRRLQATAAAAAPRPQASAGPRRRRRVLGLEVHVDRFDAAEVRGGLHDAVPQQARGEGRVRGEDHRVARFLVWLMAYEAEAERLHGGGLVRPHRARAPAERGRRVSPAAMAPPLALPAPSPWRA